MSGGDLPYRPCAGVVLINADGLIFAGRRIDRDGANPAAPPAWQMPQGGIDADEKPKAAALRELWEETGVGADQVQVIAKTPDWLTYDLPPELMGRVWGGKYRGQKQRWFLMRLMADDDAINIATEHPEFGEWRWISADDMLAAIVPFKRAVYEQVIATFRDHLA